LSTLDISVDINALFLDTISLQTTLRVRDTCLCLQLQRAARLVARRFDDALQPVGLTNGQFSLLMSLNQPEPPTIGRVAALLAMDRTTVTAMLKPLERHGFLKIRIDADDRRTRRLVLTKKARNILGRALPIWQREHGQLESQLSCSPDELRSHLHLRSKDSDKGE
jgi:DNA-binding MarR family transcriptional regulator